MQFRRSIKTNCLAALCSFFLRRNIREMV